MAISLRPVTGGSTGLSGIPNPNIGFGASINSGSYYYLVFVILVICLFVMYRIVNSHYGYALRGIHDNEKRMQALGYNTWLYKYTSWIIAAVFGGVAGVLFAYFGSTIVPNNIAMVTSDIAFLLVILGSATTFFGPLVASVIYVGIEYLASIYLPQRWPLIFGAIFVIAIMMIPDRAVSGWVPSPAAVEEGGRWRLLEAQDLSVHFGGLAAVNERQLRRRAGREAGAHRPQRRGQDDALQPAHRPAQAVGRQGLLQRPGHHSREGLRAHALGNGPLLPDHQPLSLPERHGQRHDRAAGRGKSRYGFFRPFFETRALQAAAQELLESTDLWDLQGRGRQLAGLRAAAQAGDSAQPGQPPGTAPARRAELRSHHRRERGHHRRIRDLGSKITVLMIAHDMDLVFGVAERVILLHYGEISLRGHLRRDPLQRRWCREIYMGTPQAARRGQVIGDDRAQRHPHLVRR